MEHSVFMATLALCAGFDARDQAVPGWALAALVAVATVTGTATMSPPGTIGGCLLAVPFVAAQLREAAGPADSAIILGIGTAYGYARGSVVVLAACLSAILPWALGRRERRITYIPHVLVGALLAGGPL